MNTKVQVQGKYKQQMKCKSKYMFKYDEQIGLFADLNYQISCCSPFYYIGNVSDFLFFKQIKVKHKYNVQSRAYKCYSNYAHLGYRDTRAYILDLASMNFCQNLRK